MDHNDDVGALLKGKLVTVFLICTVALISRVFVNYRIWQSLCDFHCFVTAGIVDDDDLIDDTLCHNFIVGPAQGLLGVVGGHYDYNFFVFIHIIFYIGIYEYMIEQKPLRRVRKSYVFSFLKIYSIVPPFFRAAFRTASKAKSKRSLLIVLLRSPDKLSGLS